MTYASTAITEASKQVCSGPIASGPAHVGGVVTSRHIWVDCPGFLCTRQHHYYDITIAGRTWSLLRDDYPRASLGACVVLAYGQRTGYVTSASPC